ncbi:MAG: ribonuclease R [Planctomycetota bacterium]|nr:ribonuclease R [Planctomycetota bacterium]
MASLKHQIVECLKKLGTRPVKPRKIARRLEIPKEERDHFDAAILSLISQGKIHKNNEGRLSLPETARSVGNSASSSADSSTDGLIAGVLKKTSSGSAWLIPNRELKPESGSPNSPSDPDHKIPDVHIYPEHLGDAQNGDEVLVRLLNRRQSGGRRSGHVEQIVERATHTFVGSYFEEWSQGKVRIDGGVFSDPVSVGDPGAKGAQPGDKVVIEIVRFPTHTHPGEAVVTKILGARGEPGVDLLAIVHEYGLPDEFPEEVLAAAREQSDTFDPAHLGDRLDLTGETIITIDPVDARDFDDAISLSRSADGNWQLAVHIADVAHFVPEGGALDQEAKKRGTSVYLPGRVIPMLPETISNSLASLQQGQVRFTKTVKIEFSPDGTPLHTEFHNSAIKVTKRFCYEDVMPILQSPEKFAADVSADVLKLLADMHELAMLLRGRRFENGSLELHLSEVKVELDKDGVVCGAHEVVNDESHQIIEEFMLAANTAVATTLTDAGITFLLRVHGSPDPIKLKSFSEFVDSLGLKLSSAASRFDLQKILAEVSGKPFEQAVNFALLRSMKPAEYTALDSGHYALAIENYCHFTSPIRRYPDLTVHRLFEKVIEGKTKKIGLSQIETIKLGSHCSSTERRAAQAERELTRVKLLMLLSTKVEETFSAVITGVEKFGIFCRCDKYPVDGFVHVSNLAKGERLDYDRSTYTMTARGSGRAYRMGDSVQVRIAVIDPDERTLHWELVGEGFTSHKSPSKNKPTRAELPGSPSSGKASSKRRNSRKRSAETGTAKNAVKGAVSRHKKKSAKRAKPKAKPRRPKRDA